MITYTHPMAGNLAIKTLVARQLPTNDIIVVGIIYMDVVRLGLRTHTSI